MTERDKLEQISLSLDKFQRTGDVEHLEDIERILEYDGFAEDVANILGYERPTKAIQDHVDDEDKDAIPIQDSIGRKQNFI